MTGRIALHLLPQERFLEEHWWADIWTAPAYAKAAVQFAIDGHRAFRRMRTDSAWRNQLARAAAERERQREPADPYEADAQHAQVAAWQLSIPHQLRKGVEQWVCSTLGWQAEFRYRDADPRWAAGIVVNILRESYGLLQPNPDLIDWSQLDNITVFVGTREEHNRLAHTAPTGARIVVLDTSP
ncbi:hypothetical protein ABZ468_50100 [Streptomyces sp. NPDC005708]|uniref:hypothetical protein n=1 Tax=Streptomyces sp. NPDC005708 TaxID=3154564 RepID=UPI00340AE688